jgi:nicotinamidase-related amidase
MSYTALLLIDLQRDFLETNGRLPVGRENADRVIAASLRILNHALTAGWKLIFIKNEFKKRDWLGNFSRNNSAIAGSPGAEIDPRIPVPGNAEIFSKAKSDAFSNPALEASLKVGSIRQIVMLGLMTEACVCATASSAVRRGFKVLIIADAVASLEDVAHQRGLERMRQAGAEIKESAELLSPG